MMQVLKGATMAPVRSPWYIYIYMYTDTYSLGCLSDGNGVTGPFRSKFHDPVSSSP